MDEQFDVIQEISHDDTMYNGTPETYLKIGKSAMIAIMNAINIAEKDKLTIKKILDFPSGYGRVLRYLKAVFPESTIVACDIIKEAVDFCKITFNAVPSYSTENIDKITFNDKFDLIWCGSLITHLDLENGKSILNLLISSLSDGGILIFSVHGKQAAHLISTKKGKLGFDNSQRSQLLKQYEDKGFGFVRYKPSRNYGFSLSSPSVIFQFLKKKGVRLIMYTEKGWNNHQDVIAVQADKNYF